jgi:hypothetical protein
MTTWAQLVTDPALVAQHERWRELWAGTTPPPTTDQLVRDARWLLARHEHAGAPRPAAEALVARWGISRSAARQAMAVARHLHAALTHEPPVKGFDRAAWREECRAARAARVRGLRYGLELHDAWLDSRKVLRGVTTFDDAALDLAVLRWREREGLLSDMSLGFLSVRWGWSRPRADVGDFLARNPPTATDPVFPAEATHAT